MGLGILYDNGIDVGRHIIYDFRAGKMYKV